MLHYYQHTAGRADSLITRFTRPAPADTAPVHVPSLDEDYVARVWLRTERANLLVLQG
jgi:hypothetical protein